MAGLPKKETRRLLDSLATQGCRVVERNGKAMVYFPDGATKVVHWTNSDTNSVREQRAFVKRHSMHWPFDNTKREC